MGARIGARSLTGREATEGGEGASPACLADSPRDPWLRLSLRVRSRQSFIALAPGRGEDGVLSVGEVLDDPTLKLTASGRVERLPDRFGGSQGSRGNGRPAARLPGQGGEERSCLALERLRCRDRPAHEAFLYSLAGDPRHPTKAEALRLAQEDVRATPGYQHPRFWAAFQLVGAR